jgi:hypothetical protein
MLAFVGVWVAALAGSVGFMAVKLFFASVLVLSMFSLGTLGCTEKSSTTKEVKVSTPGGTTTVTIDKEVEKTGDNPPPANP